MQIDYESTDETHESEMDAWITWLFDQCIGCNHAPHESWGCDDTSCGCDEMWTLEQADRRIASEA